ncbi:MAG: 50S ribosomal protein L29 [Nitrosomonas sp.]|nr:50S ribosomal protein L29 [Nitrosomonas sp.]MBX3641123.1 50S ribosomal protein L29 [Nitrosomonas sp.]MCW5606894.1 50S ribosomal protein L29 [Nitrosomonas sp.]
MSVRELREMDLKDLKRELHALLRIQFSLKMQLATQQISNLNLLKNNKRDIARIKTIITEKLSAL